MIHPAFAEIPDPAFAAICSEAYDDNSYVFATDPAVVGRYGTGFPPAPALLLAVTAGFLENGGESVRIKTDFTPNARAEHLQGIGNLYENKVGELQTHLPLFSSLVEPVTELNGSLQGAQEWYMDETAKLGKRLVVAHFVAQIASTGELVDTLSLPRTISNTLPLVMRNALVKLLPAIDEIEEVGLIDPSRKRKLDYVVAPILRRDSMTAKLGAILAASFLPDVARFKANTRIRPVATPSTAQENQPTENRAQRRANRKKR